MRDDPSVGDGRRMQEFRRKASRKASKGIVVCLIEMCVGLGWGGHGTDPAGGDSSGGGSSGGSSGGSIGSSSSGGMPGITDGLASDDAGNPPPQVMCSTAGDHRDA